MTKLRGIIRRVSLPIIFGLFNGLFTITVTLVYVGIVVSLVDYGRNGGGYPPFALAGVLVAIGAIVFTIAHLDESLAGSKQQLVRIGELHTVAAISLAAFGLLYPILDKMSTPYDAYCIPFIMVVLSLLVASMSIVVAWGWFIRILWTERKSLLKGRIFYV